MANPHSTATREPAAKVCNLEDSLLDMTEEVRRRWVSIAAHHVSQREVFLKNTMPDGWLDEELDSSL